MTSRTPSVAQRGRPQPAWWQRQVQHLPASRVGAWAFARFLHFVDTPLLRWSRGRGTVTTLMAGLPVGLLTTTGARSGRRRTVPVVLLPMGDDLILVAANWGGPRHPGWYHNLRVHPEAEVTLDGRLHRYRAREATPAEATRYLAESARVYRGTAAYRRRRPTRRIPVLVLTPQAE